MSRRPGDADYNAYETSAAAGMLLRTGGDDQFRRTMWQLQNDGEAARAAGNPERARELFNQYARIQSDNFPEMKKSSADLIRAYDANTAGAGGPPTLNTPGSFESHNLSVEQLTTNYRNILRPPTTESQDPNHNDYEPTRGT